MANSSGMFSESLSSPGTSYVGSYRRRLYDSSLSPSLVDMENQVLQVRKESTSYTSALMDNISGDQDESSYYYPPVYPDHEPEVSERSQLIDTPNPQPQPTRGVLAEMITSLPAVALGTLLNILDGLSYGMILFPLGTTVFAGLESAGLSLFYVSTIVSQVVFSMGASKFEACVGSEMIEVVPFFHAIANTIATAMDGSSRDAILATTVVAFAFSSVITGLVFFLLGYLNLGALVGFFPRHILVGCIGGVGWFLVATGLEVGARLPSSLEFNYETLVHLFELATLIRWGTCLAGGVLLLYMERAYPHPLIVPGLLIFMFALVHVVVAALPISLDQARDAGWLFEAHPSSEPWYEVYTLFKLSQVNWLEILRTTPVMLALTFFGIIHVPINIPALAAATRNDDVDVNQELIAHGISNTVSGLIGSIQNYLVYTNSVLFIKSGAKSHVAGFMLAGATTLVMLAGPVIIGFIPVIVVAALIFMMGFDLMAEALVDTFGKVGKQEYLTIIAIVVIMGGYDFVIGILAGIILACLFFVISSARNSPVRATLPGTDVRSTVRRHPVLQKYLQKLSSQIHIIKLQGALFFGTNMAVEQAVRDVVIASPKIKYLIVDLDKVSVIDYCTADTFTKLKRLLDAHDITMLLSGAVHSTEKVKGLQALDLIQDRNDYSRRSNVHVFPTLNYALEFCENQFLKGYYTYRDSIVKKDHAALRDIPQSMLQTPQNFSRSGSFGTAYGTTPRAIDVRTAAYSSVNEDLHSVSRWHKFKQPLPLLMQIVEGQSDKSPDFWFKLVPFLQSERLPIGSIIVDYDQYIDACYFLEEGVVRVESDKNVVKETILAGTTFGEMVFFARSKSMSRIVVEKEAVLWKLTEREFGKLKSDPKLHDVTVELLRLAFVFSLDRVKALNSYMKTIAE